MQNCQCFGDMSLSLFMLRQPLSEASMHIGQRARNFIFAKTRPLWRFYRGWYSSFASNGREQEQRFKQEDGTMAHKRAGRKGQGTVEYAGALVISALVVAGVFSAGPPAISAIFETVLGSVQDYYSEQDL